jgi:hypothetical protein
VFEATPGLIGAIFNFRVASGVVHEDVNATVSMQDGFGCSLDVPSTGDVHNLSFTAVLVGKIERDDDCSGRLKGGSVMSTEEPRTSGDDCNPPVEVEQSPPAAE